MQMPIKSSYLKKKIHVIPNFSHLKNNFTYFSHLKTISLLISFS